MRCRRYKWETGLKERHLGDGAAESAAVGRAAGAPVPSLPSDQSIAGAVDGQGVGRGDCAGSIVCQCLTSDHRLNTLAERRCMGFLSSCHPGKVVERKLI